MSLKCKSSVPRLRLPVTMSIFRCRWQRRLDWRAGRKFSGNCWSGVNYAWYDLRFQPPAEIGRSQRSVKIGFDTLSWASHPSESGNSPLKSRLSLHLLAGHHELIGLVLPETQYKGTRQTLCSLIPREAKTHPCQHPAPQVFWRMKMTRPLP